LEGVLRRRLGHEIGRQLAADDETTEGEGQHEPSMSYISVEQV
jgi:hypothetical protein